MRRLPLLPVVKEGALVLALLEDRGGHLLPQVVEVAGDTLQGVPKQRRTIRMHVNNIGGINDLEDQLLNFLTLFTTS